MKDVKITVMARATHPDLIEKYENPIEHACEMEIGKVYISQDAQKPDGLCNEAWTCMEKFVKNDEIVTLPCIHMFHKNCIKNWLDRSNICPICKLVINI